jgi:hypothetical protein
MEFLTFDNGGFCLAFTFNVDGKDKKMVVPGKDAVRANITRNFNGKYNLEIPSLVPDEKCCDFEKESLHCKYGWKLTNDEVTVFMYSEILDLPLRTIFKAIHKEESEILLVLEENLKEAEAMEDYDLCTQISGMIHDFKTGTDDIKF